MKFGQLDEALKIVQQELPIEGDHDELQCQLAVEVFKANLMHDAILELSHSIEKVIDSIGGIEQAIKEHSL
ncbi:MAG: hypothetical protein SVR94_05060 [Pseudomonadota bacterium]|nr:hypothetical protein [Pseudomonadota bacterium]